MWEIWDQSNYLYLLDVLQSLFAKLMKASPECSHWTSEGLLIRGVEAGGRVRATMFVIAVSSWLECLVCYTVRLVFSDTAFMSTQVWVRGLGELNNHVVPPVQSNVLELISDHIVFRPPPPPPPSHPEQSLDVFMYNVRSEKYIVRSALSCQGAGLQMWGQWG